MRRTLIVLACALAILVVSYRFLGRASNVQAPPSDQSALLPVKTATVKPVYRTNAAAPLPVALDMVPEQSRSEPLIFTKARIYEDADYVEKLKRHLQLRHYYKSPAKQTPEAEQIEDLLRAEGKGKAEVSDCYNAAWEYWMAMRTAGQDNADAVRREKEMRLRDYHGLTNQAFFDSLFLIQPKVFFGQRDLNLPREGEPLLEQ